MAAASLRMRSSANSHTLGRERVDALLRRPAVVAEFPCRDPLCRCAVVGRVCEGVVADELRGRDGACNVARIERAGVVLRIREGTRETICLELELADGRLCRLDAEFCLDIVAVLVRDHVSHSERTALVR